MKTKRILTAFLSMVAAVVTAVIFGGVTVAAAELTEPVSGDCGEGVTWTLAVDGSFTVSGTGEMQFSTCPWAEYKDNIKTVTIEQGVTSIADSAFSSCPNLTEVSLPDTVTELGYAAFAGSSNLSSVNFPESITTIKDYAFTNTGLKKVTLPSNLTKVPDQMFSGCLALEYVYFPDGLTDIGEGVFAGSSVKEVRLPDDLTYIPKNMFNNSTLEKVNFPSSLTEIRENAFLGCHFTEIELPEGLRIIGTKAFGENKQLKSIILPDSLEEIGSSAFAQTRKLESITIPARVTFIDNYAFHFSGIKSIEFAGSDGYPYDLEIESQAFRFCSNLLTITFSPRIIRLEHSAFEECSKLESFILNFGPDDLSWDIEEVARLFNSNQKVICYVPSEYLDDYIEAFPDINLTFKGDHEDMGIGEALAGYTLSLEGDIGVNFYMRFNDVDSLSSNAKMVFTISSIDKKNSRTREVYVKPQTDSNLPVATQKDEYYVFKCLVNAKEMTSIITAQVVDGEKKGTEYSYTVQEYAKYMLLRPQTYKKEQPLIIAMLNYGTACQNYFNYNLGDPANSILSADDKDCWSIMSSEEIRALPTSEDVTVAGTDIRIAKASLVLNSTITIKLFITGANENTVFKYGDKVLTPVKSGDYYVVRIENIPAQLINYTFNIGVFDGNKRLGVVNYSPIYYCKLVIDHETDSTITIYLKALVSTMLRYNKAANTYKPPVSEEDFIKWGL